MGGGIGVDPYKNNFNQPNYQENSQGAQGSIGSSGSGIRAAQGMGSRESEFRLPAVSNKMAMGGMKGLPGMPSSKGLDSRGGKSKHGNKPPLIG